MKARTRGRRNRRAPVAPAARGRLPLGTPVPGIGGVKSHSHIQIVSRADSEPADSDESNRDKTPIFRSSSLQFHSLPDPQLHQDDKAAPDSIKVKTFADMARNYNKSEFEGQEKPTSGPVSLAGLIKLQPSHKKTNKPWRPLEASDLGPEVDGESNNFDITDFSTLADHFGSQLHLDLSRSASVQTRASSYGITPLQVEMGLPISPVSQRRPLVLGHLSADTGLSSVTRAGSEGISPADDMYSVVDKYTRLFSKLPDQIYLHEKMGEFDGQVVFIGRPNRDVSAHQWSSTSFQWVNIGHFSHSSGRVEGSLASDRVRAMGLHPHSIEYFKMAAENRERFIRENGRPGEVPQPSQPPQPCSSVMTAAGRLSSLSTASGSNDDHLIPRVMGGRTAHRIEGQSATPTLGNVTREYLEDPFITPVKAPQPIVPAVLHFKEAGAEGVGAMNFGYQFPLKSTDHPGISATQPSDVNLQQLYVQRERERLERIRRGAQEPQANLREVDFGEEASSTFTTPYKLSNPNGVPAPLSPQDVHDRQRLKDRLAEIGEQARRPSQPAEQRVAVPDVSTLRNTTKHLLPPPGLTIANPYRVASTLNANATPYTRLSAGPETSEPSDSGLTTVHAPQAGSLRFSDPDGARQGHNHEIANCIAQDAPTRQNFRGPFFTESMPTAHDPTVSLCLPEDEEEKLTNWYRDGQRYARQQDYSKSLIATAHASSKVRNVGIIGDGPSRAQGQATFENTHPFVRLYEIMHEYAEENRAGSGQSYFTRAWKPAPLHQRDFSIDGNNSFFEDTRASYPLARCTPSVVMGPAAPSSWAGVGGFPNWMMGRKFSRVADSGFGGPRPPRF